MDSDSQIEIDDASIDYQTNDSPVDVNNTVVVDSDTDKYTTDETDQKDIEDSSIESDDGSIKKDSNICEPSFNDNDCIASDLPSNINIILPKNIKVTDDTIKYYSGSTEYLAASTITISNIITGATNLKTYYANNKAMPSTVTAGGITFKLAEFLYLMSQAIYQLGNSKTTAITYLTGIAVPTSAKVTTLTKDWQQSNYVTVAKNVASFINSNKRAPNYASSTLGDIGYVQLVDAFSRVLAFYGTNSRLPSYVTLAKSSGGGGDDQPTGKGINEKNTETSLAKYLAASTNCQVKDSTIVAKATALTKSATTAKAKATAIFNWVRDTLSYSFYYNTKYGAVKTLKYLTGNCVDHSHLLVALFRAAGLHARYVHGSCKFSSGSTYGHVWVQVLIGDTWTVADATSSKNTLGTINNWNTKTFTLKGIYASLSF